MYRGQALVILRPLKDEQMGTMTPRAEAERWTAAEVGITVR